MAESMIAPATVDAEGKTAEVCLFLGVGDASVLVPTGLTGYIAGEGTDHGDGRPPHILIVGAGTTIDALDAIGRAFAEAVERARRARDGG